MKPIEIAFLAASVVAGIIVLVMMISLIRKAEREKRELDATRDKPGP